MQTEFLSTCALKKNSFIKVRTYGRLNTQEDAEAR